MSVRFALSGAAAAAFALSASCACAAPGYSGTSNITNFTTNLSQVGSAGVLNFSSANADPRGGVAAWGASTAPGAGPVDPSSSGGGQLAQQLRAQAQSLVGGFAQKLEAEALGDITGYTGAHAKGASRNGGS